MRNFTIQADQDGRRLDRWLNSSFPHLGYGGVKRCFREKRVRLNGRHVAPETLLRKGDEISLYIDDAYLEPAQKRQPFLADFRPSLRILHRDEHLLIVDKRPGLLCHPDAREKVQTLLHHVQAYQYQSGTWDPSRPGSFSPVLVNRIDRFTGGIVLIALTKEAADVLYQKMRTREIEKRYLCIVRGRPGRDAGLLRSWLRPKGGGVEVLPREAPGAKEALTEYTVLQQRGELCLLECLLHTGRTHQIRAQLASYGHPLLGDGQYGDAAFNRRHHREFQALYACQVAFHFTGDAGPLAPLNDASRRVRDVPFVKEYFGEQ